MVDFSHLLLAAFIFWMPASVLFALVAGAALGWLQDDEAAVPPRAYAKVAVAARTGTGRGGACD